MTQIVYLSVRYNVIILHFHFHTLSHDNEAIVVTKVRLQNILKVAQIEYNIIPFHYIGLNNNSQQ